MATVRRQYVRSALSQIACLGILIVAGCRQTSSEYVEAELRVQSRRVADLENKLAQRDSEIETLRNTVTTFQAGHVKPTEAPETIYRDTALSKITLTMATGGKDADLDGKDDGVVVGVAPHDYDGDVFKCPGSCRLQLFETSAAGTRKPIGEWVVSTEQLRTLWRSSLLGQGYQLTFGWQQPPTERKLRAVVTFQTIDGRKFEAEKDFEVNIVPKSPPKLPGARIDAEPSTVSPMDSGVTPMSELPKPRGLGALSRVDSFVPPGPPLPPAPNNFVTAVRENSETAVKPRTSTVAAKRFAAMDPDHSQPPLVDRGRVDGSVNGASPGDQADAEDVIVLPAAVKSKIEIREPASKPIAEPSPPKVQSISMPASAPSKPADGVVLPDEPPPPKSVQSRATSTRP